MVPLLRPIALLLICACSPAPPAADTSGGDDGGGDGATDSGNPTDSGTPQPSCDPPTLSLAQEWTRTDLPEDHRTAHTEPGAGVGDLNGDGWPDVLVAYGGGALILWNDGAGGLTADRAGVTLDGAALPPATSVALADLDNDGDLDAYLGRHDGMDDLILWNEAPGQFRGAPLLGSTPPSWSGAFGDADGDGDLDLYVSARVLDIVPDEVLAGTQVGEPNTLYIQGSGGSFEAAHSRIPQDRNFGLTFHSAWVDVDGDGDLDIYEANDWGYDVTPNRLLINDGSGQFSEATDCACDLPMYGMGIAVGDPNRDGLPDFYVSDIGTSRLLMNLGDGSFYDATLANSAGVPPESGSVTAWGTRFADLDRDGCEDILVAFGGLNAEQVAETWGQMAGVDPAWVDEEDQADRVLLGDCEGAFSLAQDLGTEASPDRGRSLVTGDFDQDGRMDVLTAGKYFLKHWRGGGGCDPGNTLRLAGPPGNPSGLAARLELDTPGRTTTQWMLPSGTHSQSQAVWHIAADASGQVPGGRVVWPDGQQSAFDPSSPGQAVVLSAP